MSSRLIGALPTRGPWTAVGLSRGWFLGILALSLVGFAFIGGPVWLDPRGRHFDRITMSYLIIPAATALALRHVRPFPFGRLVAATVMLALIKLVVTAALLAVLVLATG
jgi:hypothetical protein